jgi:hypothetical protein
MTDLLGTPGDIYQFRIWLRGISPMIWRRILVPATTHLAAFHTIMQRAFGWDDCHLHRFHIHGCDYGIWYPGTPGFRDDSTQVTLASFHFRQHERFLYEYDFGDGWQHEMRLEQVILARPDAIYPVCTGGARAAPPENCGGPWAFLALQQQFSSYHITQRLADILSDGDAPISDYLEELHELQYWATAHQFDRRAVNRRLQRGLDNGAVCPLQGETNEIDHPRVGRDR